MDHCYNIQNFLMLSGPAFQLNASQCSKRRQLSVIHADCYHWEKTESVSCWMRWHHWQYTAWPHKQCYCNNYIILYIHWYSISKSQKSSIFTLCFQSHGLVLWKSYNRVMGWTVFNLYLTSVQPAVKSWAFLWEGEVGLINFQQIQQDHGKGHTC